MHKSLDPRPPQPSAIILAGIDGSPPILAMIGTVGDITKPMFDKRIEAISDRVIEKLDARENSTLQSLPE